jgi:cell division protein FtsI/penicillin-binding protein 2
MAQFYTALARDGSAPAPSLFTGRTDAPAGFKLKLSADGIAALRQGMREVTGPGGTAYLSSTPLWDLMGKTGTGQNSLSVQGLALDHGWFSGLAGPRGKPPEIEVTVLIEYAGHSTMSSAVAGKAADFYLRRKYGIPTDTIQILREYMQQGRPASYTFH